MDQGHTDQDFESHPKPYFLPEAFDFSALPKAVQLAVIHLVLPVYEELMIGAASSLEKSFGASYAVIATLELDQQLEVCATLNFSGTATPEECATRDRLSERLLRLVGAKMKTAQFLTRLQTLREKREQSDG